jgi:hypothetical protein
MASSLKELYPGSGKPDGSVDKAAEDTFPASDPPATGGTVWIESEDGDEVDEDAGDDASD